jgi:hypothetical protein
MRSKNLQLLPVPLQAIQGGSVADAKLEDTLWLC